MNRNHFRLGLTFLVIGMLGSFFSGLALLAEVQGHVIPKNSPLKGFETWTMTIFEFGLAFAGTWLIGSSLPESMPELNSTPEAPEKDLPSIPTT